MPSIVQTHTPLLNTPHFSEVFGAEQLPLDDQGLLRAVEMVLLPGSRVDVVKKVSPHIAQVTTNEYPGGPYYVDLRFLEETTGNAPERRKMLPPPEKILSRLEASLDLPYIWGGNWGKGVPLIGELYDGEKTAKQLLQGVDCSGLLYEATEGFTPRNTKDLIFFGKKIDSISDVKPLDILVWPGHVIVAVSPTHSIESALGKGVIIAPILERIPRTPFVIRRFN